MPGSNAAYLPGLWSSFLSAEVGASAGLTGLLFVSISINLTRIVNLPFLAPRAAKALVTLVAVLFTASVCLMPDPSNRLHGVALILVGGLAWVATTRLQIAATKDNPYVSRKTKWIYSVLTQMAVIPFVMCGVSLLYARGGGMYWIAGATLLCFTSALLDTWVLLIEILR